MTKQQGPPAFIDPQQWGPSPDPLLNRLATDPTLSRAWRELRKLTDDEMELLSLCLEIRAAAQRADAGPPPVGAARSLKRKDEALANKARALASAISGSLMEQWLQTRLGLSEQGALANLLREAADFSDGLAELPASRRRVRDADTWRTAYFLKRVHAFMRERLGARGVMPGTLAALASVALRTEVDHEQVRAILRAAS
jgi:hypothetical protein